MELYIDTSDQKQLRLQLGTAEYVFATGNDLSERLLPEIKKFLRQERVRLPQLKKIKAFAGPGPFSRIRTAVATANALAYALNLPQALIKPKYSHQPHITKSKRKFHVR